MLANNSTMMQIAAAMNRVSLTIDRDAQLKTQTGLLEVFFQKERTFTRNQKEIKLGSE